MPNETLTKLDLIERVALTRVALGKSSWVDESIIDLVGVARSYAMILDELKNINFFAQMDQYDTEAAKVRVEKKREARLAWTRLQERVEQTDGQEHQG